MKKTWILVLSMVALLSVGLAIGNAAEITTSPAAASPAAFCTNESPATNPATATPAADLFLPQPRQMEVCQVFCITKQCSKNSQCGPGGQCVLACPGVGCCA